MPVEDIFKYLVDFIKTELNDSLGKVNLLVLVIGIIIAGFFPIILPYFKGGESVFDRIIILIVIGVVSAGSVERRNKKKTLISRYSRYEPR